MTNHTLHHNPHFATQLYRASQLWGFRTRFELRRQLLSAGVTSYQTRVLTKGHATTRWLDALRWLDSGSPRQLWPLANWLWHGAYESLWRENAPPSHLPPHEYLSAAIDQRSLFRWEVERLVAKNGYGKLPRDALGRWCNGAPIANGLTVIPVLGLVLKMPIRPLIPIEYNESSPI